MSTKRDRNDLINFIVDATQDEDLAKRFLRKTSAEGIYRFFRREGYMDIPYNDCEDILAASKKMHGRGVNDKGRPVDSSSLPSRGY